MKNLYFTLFTTLMFSFSISGNAQCISGELDNSSSYPINVSSNNQILEDLNVSLELVLEDYSSNNRFISIRLTSPQGTEVFIYFSNTFSPCFDGEAFNQSITLDDEAAGIFGSSCFGVQQAINPLSAFDGENFDGTWVFNVATTFSLPDFYSFCLIPTLASASTMYTFNNGWSPSDPAGVATLDDDIVIEAGDATIASNTTANSVTVEAGASLTVNSALTAAEITLNSTSTTYASLVTGASGSVSGTITYNRFVNSNLLGNDLISPPLTGQTWASFLDPVNATALLSNPGTPTVYAFAPFDKTTGDFENYDFNTVATLTSGTGYRAATNTGETLSFTGSTPVNVNVNIVDSNTAFSEWNLVGNPYPSYLNIQSFLNHQVDTGVPNLNLLVEESTAIYGYDGNAQNGWTIYNLANTNASTVMAPGQGFFVAADATNVSAYDLEFTPNMQATGTSDDFILGRNAELTYLTLDLSSATNAYTTDFYFNANASEGLDRGYDAALWGTDAPEFSIYSHLVEDNLGKPIALQALNSTAITSVTIPLGVNANQGEQITFSIAESTLPASVNVYLDDMVANTTTLLNSGDYVLTPTINLSSTGRFFLRTSEDALSTIENNLETLNIFALNSSKEVVVSGLLQESTNLELYDIQGRVVLTTTLDVTTLENRVDVSSLSSGMYVIRVNNTSQSKTQKVILK